MRQLVILQTFSLFSGLLTPISYFDPQIVHKFQHITESRVQYYILSLYTYPSQTGVIEMDNLPYFTMF